MIVTAGDASVAAIFPRLSTIGRNRNAIADVWQAEDTAEKRSRSGIESPDCIMATRSTRTPALIINVKELSVRRYCYTLGTDEA